MRPRLYRALDSTDPPRAQDLSDEQLNVTREIYEKSEEEVRQRVDANVAAFARKERNGTRDPLQTKRLHAL